MSPRYGWKPGPPKAPRIRTKLEAKIVERIGAARFDALGEGLALVLFEARATDFKESPGPRDPVPDEGIPPVARPTTRTAHRGQVRRARRATTRVWLLDFLERMDPTLSVDAPLLAALAYAVGIDAEPGGDQERHRGNLVEWNKLLRERRPVRRK